MSRRVLSVMDDIFAELKRHISDEDEYRIADVQRHIKALGDEEPVCNFVKRAKMKLVRHSFLKLTLFEYENQRYLLSPDKYASSLHEIGLEPETDFSLMQGCEMLAIANGQINLRGDVNSLAIIEQCLGVTDGAGEQNSIVFEFSLISDLFESCCLFKLDDSRFPLNVNEDINRMICYLLIDKDLDWSEGVRQNLKSLTLLLSSRTVAASIINAVQSPLLEYTFLSLYQCIEYLFKLNNCFIIAESHNVDLQKAMDIVLMYEFKISEQDNLYRVLKDNASEATVIEMMKIAKKTSAATQDNYRKASEYIYSLRCNIAHLRYDQEDFSMVDWEKSIDALVKVILSVYIKRDTDIIYVCSNNHAWGNFSF